MAVISLPTTLTPMTNCIRQSGDSGAAIAVGEVVALNSSGKLVPAAAGVLGTSNVVGIALSAASAANQPVVYGVSGQINGATGLRPGHVYCLSSVAGDVCTVYTTDLTEGTSYVSVVAVVFDATTITLCICNSGAIMDLV